MKMIISILIFMLMNSKSKNFPERENILVGDYSKYENFMPLITLDLSDEGITDKIHIMYVSFNYSCGPEKDVNFPANDDVDHFTFKIQKDGRYKPKFNTNALKIEDSYRPYFEQSRKKISIAKAENFKVEQILQRFKNPDWLQNDATPINSKGEEFKFICQFELETFSPDDSWVYIFYDKHDREVKYVHQRT